MPECQNNRLTTFLVSIFCLLLSVECFCQVPQFKYLEVTSRISETNVLLAEQDSAGYLWLGTNKGILRYDGIAFREIHLPDSLKRIPTTALFIGDRYVFAGFSNGYMVKVNKTIDTDMTVRKICSVAITSFIENSPNSVWIGTNGEGVVHLNGTKQQRYSAKEGLADDYVHCMGMVKRQLVLGTDLGLSLCSFTDENFSTRNYDTEDGLSDNLILSICPHGDDNVLLGMQNGTVCNLNISSNRIDHFPTLNKIGISPVQQVLLLQNDILVVTEKKGAFIINWQDRMQVQQFHLDRENVQERSPLDCLVDQEGNLVVVFGDNQLVIADFRMQFISQHDGQSFADAQCLITDRDGYVWFANSNGIFRHPGDFSAGEKIEQLFIASPKMSKIVTLCEGYDHKIWFGTFGSGLGYIDPSTGKSRIFREKDGLINDNVLSLALHDSTLWMATLGGAGTLNLAGDRPVFHGFDSKSNLGCSYIYSVYNDEENRVWLGTDGKGLALFQNGQFRFLPDQFPDAGKSIVSIAEDQEGKLWFYSTDKGLQWTDHKVLKTVALVTPTEKANVFAIHSDPFGNIIALTSVGLAILNSTTENVSFVRTGFDIHVNYLNVIARDVKGRMWLGTEQAMIRFSDFNLGKKIKPRPYIEKVSVLLVPVDTSTHQFDFHHNHFSFSITSIWLQDPEAVVYQYKLSGYDDNWVTTRDRSVTFPQLQPGSYTFLLRCSENASWEDAEIQSYSFNIAAPYWQSAWFFIACAGVLILMIWLILKMRLNRIRKREMLARQKVQSQFETLRNQVNPHFLFNSFNTLISLISNDKTLAIGYVENLSDYFRIVLQQREKDVITAREELELVQSYLYLQKQRFGENLQVVIDLNEFALRSPIPPLALQLLVENAIKHNVISRSRPLTVTISNAGNEILVTNNIQEKLTKEASTGIGLENIRHRYNILFSKEIIVMREGETFTVKLPMISD